MLPFAQCVSSSVSFCQYSSRSLAVYLWSVSKCVCMCECVCACGKILRVCKHVFRSLSMSLRNEVFFSFLPLSCGGKNVAPFYFCSNGESASSFSHFLSLCPFHSIFLSNCLLISLQQFIYLSYTYLS